MTFTLGIDPGLSGALAFVGPENELFIYDMPTLSYEISGGKIRRELDLRKLAKILGGMPVSSCYIEALAGRPGMGGTQMFALGQAYGMVKAALYHAGIAFEPISPQRWKNHFGLSKDKDASREMASKVFPGSAHRWPLKKDDGKAEAALIAKYGLEQSGLFSNQTKEGKQSNVNETARNA